MNIKAKYNKAVKALTMHQSELWNTVKMMLPLENSFQTEGVSDEEMCIVPTEPNFQLPNVFLRTRKSPGCQKVIDNNRSDVEWNQTIDGVVEFFEGIDLPGMVDGADVRKCVIDRKVLGEMLRRRYGYG